MVILAIHDANISIYQTLEHSALAHKNIFILYKVYLDHNCNKVSNFVNAIHGFHFFTQASHFSLSGSVYMNMRN